jgi:hypothetical protein
MILNEKVKSPTNNRNYKKFISLGYKFDIGSDILVDIEHLSDNSRSLVDVKCDICGFEKKIKYCDYNKNYKKHNIYACSVKCANIKYRKTNMIKYGSEYPLQNKEVKDNLNQYFIDNYNGHPSKLEMFEKKKQKTNLERYGVKHQMGISENIYKIKKTKLEKYGDENYNNHELSRNTKLEKYGDENYNNHELSKKTKLEKYGDENYNNHELYKLNFLEKWGVENSFQLDFIKKNIKKQNLEKYGVEFYQKTKEYKTKFKKTCLFKYGVCNPMQIFKFFEKQQKSGFKCKEYNGVFHRRTYELNFIKYCESNKIDIEKPSSIEYNIGENKHYYFPDFYLPKYNLIVEVKSSYYFKLNESKNILKKQASLDKGYNFLFLIDKNYIELEKIINSK